MRTLAIILFVIFGFSTIKAQEKDIQTKSVSINDIINFVAKNYPQQDENDTQFNTITFAVQVANEKLETEDLVILKQAFKLMSERLNEQNSVAIVTYFGFGGVAMETTSVGELDTIYDTLVNLKEKIDSFKDDGIELAYQYAEKQYNEASNNTLIIVRNTNATKPDATKMSLKEKKKLKRKKRNKAILSTAIGLLPELIALIEK